MKDIDIAKQANMKPIYEIAAAAGIPEEALIPYGQNIAKINPAKVAPGNTGKLILVSAINPTPAGEGKTTVSVGLADALKRIGKKVILALREPSLGPVFGIKGGAAGGGYAQVVPMEEINLHFTGDIHAITSANNLLAALIDNHIQQGNALNIDPRRVLWRRCMDMNDRQLRQIVSGLGGLTSGIPREDGFDITAASEIMAILCLAKDIADLKKRVANILIAYTYDKKPVTAGDLNAQGAIAALLKNAVMPNLVQTLENTPAFIHGGPFANIAHGCNSISATRLAMSLADYVVTEAGFGADLGAEKFINIKCRAGNIAPSVVVLVATVRALKSHGGVPLDQLGAPNADAVIRGIPNLYKHIVNVTEGFYLPVVVAINRFAGDTGEELEIIKTRVKSLGVPAVIADVWASGGAGAEELAREAAALCDRPSQMDFTYELSESYEQKIEKIAKEIYGADEVVFENAALKELESLTSHGFTGLPVCVAKTQYSLSDDASLKGCPANFALHVRAVKLSAGAGFLVAFAGNIIAMPGLPKVPAAYGIDISDGGEISGLF